MSEMHPQQTQMTVEEYALLVALLAKVDKAKRFGTALFDALLAKMVGIAFEGVMIRSATTEDGWPEVYLVRRKPTETFYPNEWHCPGTFFLDGEQPADVAKRLAKWEYRVEKFERFVHVDDYFHTTPRGYIESKIYLVEDLEGIPVGQDRGWFPLNALPEATVDVHREVIIPKAIAWWWSKGVSY